MISFTYIGMALGEMANQGLCFLIEEGENIEKGHCTPMLL
jgi:hypothetical protein